MNFSLIEQRTVLAMILRNYEWSLPQDSVHHPKNGGLQVNSFGLMTVDSMELEFRRH